jgi:hypothetical protein
MKFHKLASMFPRIDGEAFDSLVEDIRANGLREPITRYEGAILDGRNRFLACQKAKAKPRFDDYKGRDPLAFVISTNVHRRHLDASQRAILANRLQTTKRGRPPKVEKDWNPNINRESVAKLFNVDPQTIWKAGKVLETGIPELVRAVDHGQISVNKAASIAKKPAKEQQKLLAAATKRAPAGKAKSAKPRGNALIRVWDAAKTEDQIIFLEARSKDVKELLDALLRL